MTALTEPLIVLTGTGTDVGKTYVAATLLQLLTQRGIPSVGLKPVETGYVPDHSDAQTLASAANHPRIEPLFSAAQPVSPHRAARQANTIPSPQRLHHWVLAQAAESHRSVTVVETAGGLFSPLSTRSSSLDLVAALEPCRFVLVAADRLGVLHDVVAAVHAARALHRAPDAVILNQRDPTTSELENRNELERLELGLPIFAFGNTNERTLVLSWLLRTPMTTPPA